MRAFLQSQQVHRMYNSRTAQLAAIRRGCGQLARLVEQLAPAVGGVARPENAEYPWAQGEEVLSLGDGTGGIQVNAPASTANCPSGLVTRIAAGPTPGGASI